MHDEMDVAILGMTKDDAIGVAVFAEGLLDHAYEFGKTFRWDGYVLVDDRRPCRPHGADRWHQPFAQVPQRGLHRGVRRPPRPVSVMVNCRRIDVVHLHEQCRCPLPDRSQGFGCCGQGCKGAHRRIVHQLDGCGTLLSPVRNGIAGCFDGCIDQYGCVFDIGVGHGAEDHVIDKAERAFTAHHQAS